MAAGVQFSGRSPAAEGGRHNFFTELDVWPCATRSIIDHMVWFFERGGERLEIKTRYDNETAEYVLEVLEPGDARPVERFLDASAFRTRLLEIERELDHMQWRADGAPRILTDGWPDRTPSR